MARRVAHLKFDELLDSWIELPLDDADQWTIELANAVNGRNLTEEQFATTIKLFNAEYLQGIDISTE